MSPRKGGEPTDWWLAAESAGVLSAADQALDALEDWRMEVVDLGGGRERGRKRLKHAGVVAIVSERADYCVPRAACHAVLSE